MAAIFVELVPSRNAQCGSGRIITARGIWGAIFFPLLRGLGRSTLPIASLSALAGMLMITGN